MSETVNEVEKHPAASARGLLPGGHFLLFLQAEKPGIESFLNHREPRISLPAFQFQRVGVPIEQLPGVEARLRETDQFAATVRDPEMKRDSVPPPDSRQRNPLGAVRRITCFARSSRSSQTNVAPPGCGDAQ